MAQPQTKGDSTPRSSAADVFSYLLLFLMLYIGAFAFLALMFDFIDVWFEPAGLSYYPGQANSFIIGTASLLVVWPIYIIMSWLTGRWMQRDASRKNLAVRRWLVYMALFVTAVTMIVDLIVLVYNFLSGGLTANFLVKVITVFVVAAVIFGYYLWDLRRRARKSVVPLICAIVASLIVVAALVGGFFVVGTPSEQRAQRFDNRRLNDLYQIQNETISYYQGKKELPDSLADLENDVTGFVLPTDPETGESYGYNRTDELMFELCAEFASEQTFTQPAALDPFGVSAFEPYTQNWNHPAGEHCFDRVIDPERLNVTTVVTEPTPASRKTPSQAESLPQAEPEQASYTNSVVGYTVRLPEGWVAQELSIEGSPFCELPSNIISFVPPDGSLGVTLGVRPVDDPDLTIWCRTGIGAGAAESGGSIVIGDEIVPTEYLVYEDRIIEFFIGVLGVHPDTIGPGMQVGEYVLVASINSQDIHQNGTGDLTELVAFDEALELLESIDLP